MNKFALLCCTLLLTASVPALAESAVEESMKGIVHSYKAAMKADDAASLKQELQKMRDYAVKGQAAVPEKLAKEPTTSPDRQTYSEGMTKLVKQIDDALALLDAGKFDEAKKATKALQQTKHEYHGKLKV